MPRTLVWYPLLIGLATAALFVILHFGRHLPLPGQTNPSVTSASTRHLLRAGGVSFGDAIKEQLHVNATDSLSRFFLQLFVVIAASYLVGWIFTRCGQPAVVGEMMAGVFLGPSLFGLIAPTAFKFVFAASSLEPLHLLSQVGVCLFVLSQVGVCLFMFAVGMEMDWAELRQKASAAILVSHVSIAAPCVLGAGLAYLLYDRLASPGAPFVPFALFVAISMSITAFPVLVRILQDRGILRTSLGRTASAAAAMGDVTAWGLLAFVVALAKSSDFRSAAFCLGLVALFVVAMFGGLKPLLPRLLGRAALEAPKPSKGTLALVVGIVLA